MTSGHKPNTDSIKLHTKKHIFTDEDGIPLSAVIISENSDDFTVAIDTVDILVIKKRPSLKSTIKYRNMNNKKKKYLYFDKAY